MPRSVGFPAIRWGVIIADFKIVWNVCVSVGEVEEVGELVDA